MMYLIYKMINDYSIYILYTYIYIYIYVYFMSQESG